MSLDPEPITVLEPGETGRGAGEGPENGDVAGDGGLETVGEEGLDTAGEEGSTSCGFFPKMVKFPPEKEVEYKRLGAISSRLV
jgi:hypothetical protein